MTVLLTLEDLLSSVEDLAVGPLRDVGLLDSLVGNHALVDGNERLGWLAVVVFHGLNDVDLDAPDGPAYALVMSVARRDPSIDQIAAVLSRWH